MKKQTGKSKPRQTTQNKPPTRNYLPLLLLVAALLLVLIVRLRLVSLPFERDEGEYAYFGQLILQGIPPYEAAYNLKFPGTYYSYALIMAFFGQSVEAIRIGVLLFSLGSILLLYGSVRRLFNPLTGSIAAAAMAILSLSWSFQGVPAHATHFVTFWAVLGLYLLVLGHEKNKIWLYLLSGFSFGCAVMMKQSGVFFPVAGFLIAGTQWFFLAERRIPKLAAMLGIYSLGAILPLALTFLTMSLAGVWNQFTFWTLEYPSVYGSRVSGADIWPTFQYNFAIVFRYTYLLWITGGLGLVALFLYPGKQLSRITAGLFVVFALANVMPGFYFRQHYFIPFIPALALLTGILFDYLNQRISRPGRNHQWITVSLFLILMIPVLNRNKDVFFLLPSKSISDQYYFGNPFSASVPVGKFLRESTKPGDRIFVFGSEPQLYFYAQRQSSTGYIYMYDLVFNQPFAREMQEAMMQEVDSNPPKMVVFASSSYSWLSMPGYTDTLFNWFNRHLTEGRFEFSGIVDIISPTETNFVWGKDCLSYKPISENTLRIFRRPD